MAARKMPPAQRQRQAALLVPSGEESLSISSPLASSDAAADTSFTIPPSDDDVSEEEKEEEDESPPVVRMRLRRGSSRVSSPAPPSTASALAGESDSAAATAAAPPDAECDATRGGDDADATLAATQKFDRQHMVERLRAMKQSAASTQEKGRSSVVWSASRRPDAITVSDDDEEESTSDARTFLSASPASSPPAPSPPIASGWRRTRRGAADVVAQQRSLKSSRPHRAPSPSDESAHGSDDDSDFEIDTKHEMKAVEPRATRRDQKKAPARSDSRSLKDMWKGSSQPTRTYQLPITSQTAAAATTRTASPTCTPTPTPPDRVPSKRYRSLIADEDDDDDVMVVERRPKRTKSTATSTPTSTTSHAAPRKATLSLTIAADPSPLTPPSLSSRPPSVRGPPSVLWIDKYAPRTESDLCVHAKKLAEVKTWLQQFGSSAGSRHLRGHTQSMLILTGPSGCCKSAMIRVLAATLGYGIVTWDDNTNNEAFVKRDHDGSSHRSSHSAYVPYESRLAQFQSFFSSATRYVLPLRATDTGDQAAASAIVSTNSTPVGATSSARSLVVLEEFPFVKEDQRAEFQSLLLTGIARTTHPIVFILTTENENKATAHDLEREFGVDIMRHQKVHVIHCNPISDTGLRQALQRVTAGEGIELAPEHATHLRRTCNGDVRHAIQTLQFQFVAHSARPDLAADSRKSSRRKLRASADNDTAALPSFTARDESFSIFHSVGKILYAKSSEFRSVDAIIEAADVEPTVFLEWVHANYIDHITAPVVPKTDAKGRAGRKSAKSTKANSQAISLLSPPSFFDDDMDGDAFDQMMNGASVQTADFGTSTSPSDAAAALQSEYDEDALLAMVSATHHLSDADLLAAASHQSFGDSQHALDSMQAAEVACRGFMLSKRSCAWVRNPPTFRLPHSMMLQSGPLSGRLFRLQQQKHRLFRELFLTFADHVTLELDTFIECVRADGRPTLKQANAMRQMQGFAGRDLLLPSADTFLDLLPYLHIIAQVHTAHSPLAPRAPYAAPASIWSRPRVPGVAGGPTTSGLQASPLPRYMHPKPSSVQLTFLRQLATYHLHTTVDAMSRDQTNAIDVLHRQAHHSASSVQTAAVLPTVELLEEIEEIENE